MTVDFSNVANKYHKLGVNQQSAGVKLINLLTLCGSESVIDIGCGNGRLTSLLAKLTTGNVVGIDISKGMIKSAREFLPRGRFIEGDIETLPLASSGKFDVAFINSVMHWFRTPEKTLKRIQQLLTSSSCLAVQTPLKTWCPELQEAIEKTVKTSQVSHAYSNYHCPWFHLRSADEYVEYFKNLGFNVGYAEEDSVFTELHNPLKLWDLFESGPAHAYFDPNNFSAPMPANLPATFKTVFCSIAEGMAINNAEYKRAFFILRVA
ncbi:class I SAM-dependent methyltransferase [Hahella aquimaris]|uniref:class I SAM-dependent methyltransferase n=1 Tax=Hahella sp. HNIBRBA332 TaxID=3015983 RepID=UPI00273AA10F|nr:class I SAM-dependent methyltransferase [Hahella sp. HNIBRBA332]WLQ13256.1 class I SAM-dependent methyltransferase [Hahella sp. HNIBRBA332]